jgi:hypothetical protein
LFLFADILAKALIYFILLLIQITSSIPVVGNKIFKLFFDLVKKLLERAGDGNMLLLITGEAGAVFCKIGFKTGNQ